MKDNEGDMLLGVGDGTGQLFVKGSYDAIKACQASLLRKGELEVLAFHTRTLVDAMLAMGKEMPIDDVTALAYANVRNKLHDLKISRQP